MGTAIVFGDLLFTTTNRLIVIRRLARPDTPHLCILFETDSGEIDLHLKYESARNDKTSTYEPLIRFSKSMAVQLIENQVKAFKPELLSFLWKRGRKTRPGWLAKHGYLIALIDEDAFKSSMYAAAPKKRGKHRVNLETMKEILASVDPSAITLLEPAVLNTLEMRSYRGLFFAVSSTGKRRMIPMRYIRWSGRKPAWIGLDGVAKEFPMLMQVIIPAELREQVRMIWYRVYDALRLDEMGLTRD